MWILCHVKLLRNLSLCSFFLNQKNLNTLCSLRTIPSTSLRAPLHAMCSPFSTTFRWHFSPLCDAPLAFLSSGWGPHFLSFLILHLFFLSFFIYPLLQCSISIPSSYFWVGRTTPSSRTRFSLAHTISCER